MFFPQTKYKCRFCVGDRFYLCDNKILCENDYADREMQSQLMNQQQNNSNISMNNNNNMNNNNSEFSINRNANRSQMANSSNSIMPLYSEKNNFSNFDVPIHVRWIWFNSSPTLVKGLYFPLECNWKWKIFISIFVFSIFSTLRNLVTCFCLPFYHFRDNCHMLNRMIAIIQ